MSYPSYPEYKESGLKWIPRIPSEWQLIAIGRVLAAPVTDGPHLTPEFLDEGIPFLSVDSIQDGSLNFDYCRYISFEDHKEFRRKAAPKFNDILMGKAASIGKIARVTDASKEFSIWSPLALIRTDPRKCKAEYLEFCLKSEELQVQIYLAANSNTQLNIGMKDVPKLRIAMPRLSEQTQIARFLDHQTARIDALIAEQQRLIELLKEKRQAVISHAVTKGLDPDVAMKDSGVEWLGEVPAHWNKKRLKNISPFISVGIVVNPSSYIVEEGLPFIYGGEIKDGFIDVNKARKISPRDSLLNSKTQLETNDLLTIRVGYPGLTAVVTPECEGGNCASVMLIKHGYFDSRWLCALMNSRLIQQQVEVVQYGAAQKQFNIADAVEFWLFEPPRSEQTVIASFIDDQCLKYDQLINEAKNSTDLLQERRSALISAAVTGKIDVRGWQPRSSETFPDSFVTEGAPA